MTKLRALALAPLLALLTGCATTTSTPTTAAPAVLPLQRLRLYESGVAYFERGGALHDDAGVSLPVPSGHLDDALKSLVVLSAGEARFDGVAFESRLSHGMARAMAGLELEEGANVSHVDLLESLRGSEVEVREGTRSVVGRLIEIEVPPPNANVPAADGAKAAPGSLHDTRLTLLAKEGEVVRVVLSDATRVKPTDPAHAARLDAALASLLDDGGPRTHALRIAAQSGAPIRIGYIAETPIWRASYRIVLSRAEPGSTATAALQGYALLHNDTDEAWRGVQVELVHGRPDSFLFPLAAPRYARRPLATPENPLSTVPQLLDQTADTLWGDHLDTTLSMGASGTAGYGSGSGYGYGSGSGRLGGMHRAASPVYDTASDLLAVGNLAAVAEAQGAEEGALFVYTMPSPLALAAHESALVPFLSQSVEAAPITRVQASDPSSPRSAVRFVNTTSQTLPAGPIAFFAGGGFAGESALDRLAPKERRFIEFGQDLDVEATSETAKTSQKIARISFEQQLLEHYVRTTVTPWTFENRSAEPREIHLLLALERNAKVTGGDAVEFDSELGRAVVVVMVAPRSKVQRTILSEEGLAHPTSLDRIASKRLAELAALPDLPAGDRALALEGEARARELEQTRAAVTSTKEEIARVEAELERLRANAKALTGPGATAQPLVTRMLAAEDRLAKLNDKLRELEAESPKRTEALRVALAKWRP